MKHRSRTTSDSAQKNGSASGKRKKGLTLLEIAMSYHEAGLCVIPTEEPPSKKPKGIKWEPYQKRLPTSEELKKWFSGDDCRIAIICGAISGGLETIDFEREEDFERFIELVRATDADLVGDLAVGTTPGHMGQPGVHVRYRVDGVIPPRLLLAYAMVASRPTDADNGVGGNAKRECIIETRGEGHYALAPGLPPADGDTRGTYAYRSGPSITRIRKISREQRDMLISLARSLGEPIEEAESPAPSRRAAGNGGGLTVLDNFDLNGWPPEQLFEPKKWKVAKTRGEVSYLRHPNTTNEYSATFGKCRGKKGEPLFHCFSPNAHPFEADQTYGRSRVYALLYCGGDLSQAARELADKGFGSPSSSTNGRHKGRPPSSPSMSSSRNGDGADQADADQADGWEKPIPLNRPPSVVPFPVDVFPVALAGFIEEVAKAQNCPPDYVAVPMLAVAAGCIGNSTWIEIKRDRIDASALWVCVIGNPGTGKTPAFKAVLQPVQDLEWKRILAHKKALAEWEKEGKLEDKEQPRLGRCIVSDITTETLSLVLSDNPRGLIMEKDELVSLVTSMNQYKSSGGHDRQQYLALWSHRLPARDRKTDKGPPIILNRAFLCIVGGTQPDVLPAFFGDAKRGGTPPSDGFLDRFMFSWADELPAIGEQYLEVSPESKRAWELAVADLYQLCGKNVAGEEVPQFLALSIEGKREWAAFTSRHAADLNTDGFPSSLKGVWSKLEVYAGRLALIMQCLHDMRDGPKGYVDGESIKRAEKLVDYFKSHARKTYALMVPNHAAKGAQRILDWLIREKVSSFKKYEAHRDLRSDTLFPTLESMDRPLSLLEEHYFLRELAAEDARGPGRKKAPSFEVNPLWDRRENRENRENEPPGSYFPDFPDFPDPPQD